MSEHPDPLQSDASVFRVGENDLRVFHDPDARLDAVLGLIDRAEKSIRAFYYQVADDEVGELFMDALCRACQRGVDVELVIDAIGSHETPDAFFDRFLRIGGTWNKFSSRWTTRMLIRNHQKILIVDSDHTLISGFNIAREYFGRAGDLSWEDMAILISGEDACVLCEYFDQLAGLARDGHARLHKVRRLVKQWSGGSGAVTWLLGGPGRLSPWVRELKGDLEHSERLDMVAAYFSPGHSVLRRIGKIARKGNTRLMLAGKSDHEIAIQAHRLTHGYLLRHKAKLYEYQARRLHKKMILLDDAVYIGSSNMDARSLFINLEIMVRIESAELAEHLRGIVGEMTAESIEITPELRKARAGLFARLRWLGAYFMVSTLDLAISHSLGMTKTQSPAAALPAPEEVAG